MEIFASFCYVEIIEEALISSQAVRNLEHPSQAPAFQKSFPLYLFLPVIMHVFCLRFQYRVELSKLTLNELPGVAGAVQTAAAQRLPRRTRPISLCCQALWVWLTMSMLCLIHPRGEIRPWHKGLNEPPQVDTSLTFTSEQGKNPPTLRDLACVP